MIVYLDTSALVKRYITETGSRWIRSLLNGPAVYTFTSQLTTVEGACAFARRRREGYLAADEQRQVLEMLFYELNHRYSTLRVTPQLIDIACRLADRWPLRAFDAVHLAAAWLLNQNLLTSGHAPLTFVCADIRLLDIAQSEGMLTENPNDHP